MNDDMLFAMLELVLAEIRAVRQVLERGRAAPQALRKAQAGDLARIVPVLAGAFGAVHFSCWEVCDLARHKTSEGANVRIALAGRTARQLGKLLQAGQGHDFDGVRIERAGEDGNGVLWKCVGSALP